MDARLTRKEVTGLLLRRKGGPFGNLNVGWGEGATDHRSAAFQRVVAHLTLREPQGELFWDKLNSVPPG